VEQAHEALEERRSVGKPVMRIEKTAPDEKNEVSPAGA
jgi:hypothetical protein